VRDFYLDFVLAKIAWTVFVRQQLRTGRVHSETMNVTH
jgi:hypothetical protein